MFLLGFYSLIAALKLCIHVHLQSDAVLLMQDLPDCDFVFAERECYLLDGEAGFEGL